MAYGGGHAADRGADMLAETTRKQHAVSCPQTSAWVSANAGAGKTHVLIQRVTRLLLNGCQPGRIVCITYTKAAAAEMADRLFRRLSGWALTDDDTLREALAEVVGAQEAAAADLAQARLLFARALETPGGLKIQTIHSFCEMVLRRFPAEAGLLPGFTVLEEADARRLHREVIEAVATEALGSDPLLLADFDTVGSVLRPDASQGAGPGGFQRDLHDVLAEFAAKGPLIAKAHEAAGGTRAFCDALYARHGLASDDDEASVQERLRRSIDVALLRDIETRWSGRTTSKGGLSNAAKFAEKVVVAFAGGLTTASLSGLVLGSDNGLLKNACEGRNGPGDKDAYKLIDRFAERWNATRDAIIEAIAAEKSLRFCAFNAALHRLGALAARRYAAAKDARGYLDFDDLIARTGALLRDTSNAWVLYKLDQGIDHLLLDEAQDTGEDQWDVIWQLTDEFYPEEGVHRPRTLFVVGDEKQSIYSFQGADAELFAKKRAAQAARVRQLPFVADEFGLSFRSTPAIMRFVDEALRQDGDLLLKGGFAPHQSRFPGAPGSVEVWPLIGKQDAEEAGEETETRSRPRPQAWDLPVDARGADDPHRVLAETICDRIEAWCGPRQTEPLPHAGRPVRPGDVMILFQRRGPGFHEMVQALSRRGIPTAGADRVRLKEDVAVRDLIALLRFCTNTGDCLSLAELLKSPFWRLDDDDLIALAPQREGRLWSAVREAAEDDPNGDRRAKCAAAVREIEAAMTAGRAEGAFALLTSILDGTRDENGRTGRQRIAARLGKVPDEALGEVLGAALAFEAREPRSVEGFLAEIEGSSGDVKKDQGGSGQAVRVMTVHGAKGLEAPIVILADASYCKRPSQLFGLGTLVPTADGTLLCGGGRDLTTPVWEEACDEADARRMAEYRRLFYVGATRAEERLIVCGVQTEAQKKPEALADRACEAADWHTLASRALDRIGDGVVTEATALGDLRRYVEEGPSLPQADETAAAQAPAPISAAWLRAPVATERADRIHNPSRLRTDESHPGQGGAPDPDEPDATAPAYPPRPPAAANPYLRGTVIHSLLERLPDIAPDRRATVGHTLASRYATGAPPGSADAWLGEALAVLNSDAFGEVFGPDSKAEVPIIGRVGGRMFSGAIDRLVVRPDRVLIVDYKSNRPPPAEPSGVQADYLDQLAAYAALVSRAHGGRPCACALLWTYAPRLMPIPSDLLEGRLG